MNPASTLAQQRQARGKEIEEKDRHATEAKGKKRVSYGHDEEDAGRLKSEDELFEERERRHTAARILESNELLIFHSHANDESIPQTRLRFEKMMVGLEPDGSDNDWEDDYEDEGSEGASTGTSASRTGDRQEGGIRKRLR
ncbi:hypothetical protein L228DRAFT_270728 [Xylona heveae TC161]|uniref:Uncharacterized protein n=1 Tax=Xylona heveae (strain CBS 132557 / TC161) TaxID=1328760 RepID=A0A165A541_XYLHT|nr:hypothetical protein L228DRAFT_270728 [Xylona heveae TC161]KZF19961.1 hypothetical protein L228DRAFT_270728 [Xylona heveae TC161]